MNQIAHEKPSRIALTIPPGLHQKLKDSAIQNRRSMHQQALFLLEQSLTGNAIAQVEEIQVSCKSQI